MNLTNNNYFLDFGKFYSIIVLIIGTLLGLLFLIAGINALRKSFNNKDSDNQYNNGEINRKNTFQGIILIIVAILTISFVYYFVWKSFHSNRFAAMSAYDGVFNVLYRN